MIMSKIVAEKDYEIHYYEVDYKRNMLITSLIDFLGDIAIYQSELLGVGIDYLRNNNLVWVLYQWDIKINTYPSYGDKVRIRTYAYGFRRFYAYRKFQVLSSSGDILAEADSVWFLVDAEKRKPMRITEEFYGVYGIESDCKDYISIDKIEKIENADFEKMFDVRYSDIDTNRHVNNAKYVAWAIEGIPMDIVTENSLLRIKITYEKETKYGETVKSKVQVKREADGIKCIHVIEDFEGNELTKLETYWK